ncbi:sulfur carrier protein ThiS [Cnuella takakiae]|uniref:Sulfur carrier protein ThiS n=1 Tax=Cnuella takakiae TaxID=1302690 RepID=A0A1M5IWL6_9BACT|nr:sulfur carrier protein ThiS [Cnuella takakiae]OLY91433.1 thiamine biosynthesis protein ThiS [Cnuella takakiae]SHG32712.1 sulfur carrier protein ThiS [Cnuella takakiae]
MEIYINDQPQVFEPGASVQQIVDAWAGEKQKGIAVAINNTVVPRANWKDHLLQDHDRILLIKATQGG